MSNKSEVALFNRFAWKQGGHLSLNPKLSRAYCAESGSTSLSGSRPATWTSETWTPQTSLRLHCHIANLNRRFELPASRSKSTAACHSRALLKACIWATTLASPVLRTLAEQPCNCTPTCGLHKSRMKIKWLNQPKESVRSGPKKKSFTTVVSRPLSIWELAWLLADRPRRIDRERFQRQCDRHDAIPPPHLRTQLGANWTHYDIQNINSSAASARALGWVLRANDCS